MATARTSIDGERDPLTATLSRTGLSQALAERSAGPGWQFVVAVENLGQLNRAIGPAAGDRLLQGIAGTIVAAVRSIDCVARSRGSQFLVVIYCRDEIQASRVAARVHRRVVAWLAACPIQRPPPGVASPTIEVEHLGWLDGGPGPVSGRRALSGATRRETGATLLLAEHIPGLRVRARPITDIGSGKLVGYELSASVPTGGFSRELQRALVEGQLVELERDLLARRLALGVSLPGILALPLATGMALDEEVRQRLAEAVARRGRGSVVALLWSPGAPASHRDILAAAEAVREVGVDVGLARVGCTPHRIDAPLFLSPRVLRLSSAAAARPSALAELSGLARAIGAATLVPEAMREPGLDCHAPDFVVGDAVSRKADERVAPAGGA